jgi:phosphatidate cytidylyltransferase
MKELGKRVLTAIIGIPLAIFIILKGGLFFAIAISVVIAFAMFEFYKMAENKGHKPIKTPTIVLSVLASVLIYLTLSKQVANFNFVVTFLAPTLIGTVVLALALFRKEVSAITDISISIAGAVYAAFPLVCLIAIREYGYANPTLDVDWGYFTLIMFITIWVCDSAAYFIGKAVGKHKLFPRHSPKKSWEGSIAGFVFGTAFFVGLTAYFNPNVSYVQSAVLGMVISTFCQLGDLIESHFKRDVGVKDSSNFFPGHGGFLDRFDGVIYISPIVLLVLIILF